MNNTIKLLSPDLINKIAAGEVVERPASIVKELLENSIDAKANKIILKIESGGINLIEVSDDGIGMVEDDAKLAFVQHATSKIQSIDDLKMIYTLGFRGEALASIASVSELSIHTKTETSKSVFAKTLNGKIITESGQSRNRGTTIKVTNLFDKIPARKKFLKSELTEYKNILNLFIRIALPHYNISFEFYNNSKLIHSLSKVDKLKDRVIQLFPNLDNQLIPILFDDKGLQISGYIGHPESNRRDTSIQYIFVNNRSINDPIIAKAMKSGYGTNLMHNQYPIYFLNIRIDENKVDVNVHPRKSEIRFDNSKEMFRVVHNCVRNSLEKHLQSESKERLTPEFTSNMPKQQVPTQFPKSIQGQPNRDFSDKKTNLNTQTSIDFTRNLLRTSNEVSQNIEPFETEPQVLQIFNTYFLLQHGDTLQFIDQHAADERINFERIEKMFKENKSLSSQKLLISEDLSITKQEQLLLLENKKLLSQLGFEFKINGNKTELSSIPEGVYSSDTMKTFKEILASLDDSGEPIEKEENSVLRGLIATIACHSSIRAGQKLESYQLKELFKQLLKCKQPYSCPHGRPIIWIINKAEIEKNFKRK